MAKIANTPDGYFKVLAHLHQFHTDGQFHNIETALGEERPYRQSAYFKNTVSTLRRERWIEVKLGSGSVGGVGTYTDGEKMDGDSSGYRPLMARITLAGMREYRDQSSFFEARPKSYPIENAEEATNAQATNQSRSDPPTKSWQQKNWATNIILFILGTVLTYMMAKGCL